eukprot:4056337-Pleurochrysis_carterae.AAC.1
MVQGRIVEEAAAAEVAAGMIGIELAAWRRRSKMKKKADRVAVMTARRPCMITMLSEGCAGAMALSTVGSVHMSISSQQSSVHAA